MENYLVRKYVKVSSEIAFHNQRLSEPGKKFDGLGDATDENKHLDSAQKEGPEEATKNCDGWVHCDMCDYKCKKQATF